MKIASGIRSINHYIFVYVILYKNKSGRNIRCVGKIVICYDVFIGSNSTIMDDEILAIMLLLLLVVV